MRDDILKFNKGRTNVLINLIQRLKSGAEQKYQLTFLMIFDDFQTFTDVITDITFDASRSCCIEKQNVSQVKVTKKMNTYESHMSGDRT